MKTIFVSKELCFELFINIFVLRRENKQTKNNNNNNNNNKRALNLSTTPNQEYTQEQKTMKIRKF
jgi:hypothetical protein